MRVIITGATGFIGTNLVEYLRSNFTYELICLSRKTSDQYYTDYSIDSLKKIFDEGDVIVHLAASRGNEDTFSPYLENIIITDNVIAAAKEKKVQKIIYTSSISVYSNQELIPWTENLCIEPKNYYGLSKAVSEKVIKIGLEQTKIHFYNLRLAHVFGANEKNNYMINLSIYNHNENRREMVYIKDVVRAISNCISDTTLASSGITLNIGSGEALTNYEIACKISKVFNTKEPIIESVSVDTRKNSSLMNGDFSENLGLYSPKFKFEEAIRDVKEIMEDMDLDLPEFY